jgi:hypothetical protein
VTVEVETPKRRATSERERNPPLFCCGDGSESVDFLEGVMAFTATMSPLWIRTYDARHTRDQFERYGLDV